MDLSVAIASYRPEAEIIRNIASNISVICKVFPGAKIELIGFFSGVLDREQLFISRYFRENRGRFERADFTFRAEKVPAAKARNHCLKQANGKFVYFLDDDDELRFKSEIDLCAILDSQPTGLTFSGFYNLSDLVKQRRLHHMNFLFRKDALKIWDEDAFPGEDWLFVAENCNDASILGLHGFDFLYNKKRNIYPTGAYHGFSRILTLHELDDHSKQMLITSIQRNKVENLYRSFGLPMLMAKSLSRLHFWIVSPFRDHIVRLLGK